MTIHENELLPETRAKLGLGKGKVPGKVIVLGRLLQAIDGLTTRDACWALRTAHAYVRGYRKPKTKPSPIITPEAKGRK